MKKIALLFIVFSLGVFNVFSQQNSRMAQITKISGEVEVKLSNEKKWKQASIGMNLDKADHIRTKNESKAVVKLVGGDETATVDMDSNSTLSIAEFSRDDQKNSNKTLLDLEIGKILIKVDKLQEDVSKFEVKTPTSIIGVRGTTFAVEVENLDL